METELFEMLRAEFDIEDILLNAICGLLEHAERCDKNRLLKGLWNQLLALVSMQAVTYWNRMDDL